MRAAPDELRARLVLGWSELDGALAVRLERVDHPRVNRVIGVRSAAQLESLLGDYRAAGLKRFAVYPAHDAPAELRARLLALGLSATASLTTLGRDTSPAAAAESAFAVTVAGPRDAHAVGRVTCAGFGLPAPLGLWTAALVGRDGWRAFLAWDGDQPVAAGLLHIKGELGWLGGDATLPSHRGRGAQSALIARRIDEAQGAGARLLAAECERPGNLEKAGFAAAYTREVFTQTA